MTKIPENKSSLKYTAPKPGLRVGADQDPATVSSIRFGAGNAKNEKSIFPTNMFVKNMSCSENDTFRTNIRKKYVACQNLRTVEFQNLGEIVR